MGDSLEMLESAGELVWRASWHAVLLAILVLLVSRALGKVVSAGWRSALWVVVFIRLAMPLAPPSSTSLENLLPGSQFRVAGTDQSDEPAAQIAESRQVETGNVSAASHGVVDVPRASAGSARQPIPWTAGLLLQRIWLIGWLVGLVIVSIRYGWAALRLRRMIRSFHDVKDPRILRLAEECQRECGLTHFPVIKHGPRGIVPSLAGVVRPVLLLPEKALQMDRESLRFILLHEMRHIRVGDCLVAWWIRCMVAIHWFNPFVWLGARCWRAERELACDAWVLRHAADDEMRRYGNTLLAVLGDASLSGAMSSSIGMVWRSSLIERRIQQMKRRSNNSRWTHCVAASLLLAVVSAGLTDSVRSEPAANDAESEPNSTARQNQRVADAATSGRTDIKLQKILDAWQKRQARVRTWKYVYSSRVHLRKEGRAREIRPRRPETPSLPFDQLTDLKYTVHFTFFFDGLRMGYRFHGVQRGRAATNELMEVTGRKVFDGKECRHLHVWPSLRHGTGPFPQYDIENGNKSFLHIGNYPFLFAYRMQEPKLFSSSVTTDSLKVNDKRVLLDGRNCVVLRAPRFSLWVDPSREFVIVRYRRHGANPEKTLVQMELDYSKVPADGWVLTGWTKTRFSPAGTVTSSTRTTVTEYEMNPKIPDSEFQIEIPDGALIWDARDRNFPKTLFKKRDGVLAPIPDVLQGLPYPEIVKSMNARGAPGD